MLSGRFVVFVGIGKTVHIKQPETSISSGRSKERLPVSLPKASVQNAQYHQYRE